MLITIKTLKQETFKVEVEPSDKVLTIKQKIEELQGHPVSSKILVDENPVEQYNISEKDFLVIMVTKAKAAAASTSKPAAPATSEAPSTPAAPAAPATSSAPVRLRWNKYLLQLLPPLSYPPHLLPPPP
ncbi:UV excision repair protein rad23 [Mortierella sp. AM989]|nr:UV excision repair protein rad23 [Mortierella sp. AM989]